MLTLRPYQSKLIDETREHLRRVRRVLIQLPTGGGKTALASRMLHGAADRGRRVWFLCHRRELVRQVSAAFTLDGLQHSIVAADQPMNTQAMAQICSIPTLVKRAHLLPAPDLICWDECVTGNTKLITNIGCVAIRDVPSSGATMVLARDKGKVVWRQILAWRKTGEKRVRRIQLRNGQEMTATSNHPIFTKSGWIPTGEITIGDDVLCCPQAKDAESWEHWLATSQSHTQIKDQKVQGFTEITARSRQSGARTKQVNSYHFNQKYLLLKIKGLALSWRDFLLPAVNAWRKFTSWLEAAAQNNFQENGSMLSALKVSLGGIATTEHCMFPIGMHDSTLRDSERMEAKLPLISFLKNTGTPSFMSNADVFLSDWIAPAQRDFSKISDDMSRNVCDTSWAKVISADWCEPEDVFDISVESAHNFFGNGLLVHNCHHVASKSWASLASLYPKAFHVGLSATPERLDGRGLADHFDAMVRGPTVAELIDAGYLSKYRLFAPATVDTSGLHRRMGDYVTGELDERINTPKITGDAIGHYQRYCDGARALVFCVSIDHSRAVARSFCERGITAFHLDGNADNSIRDGALHDFRSGKIRVITNVDLFSEGFDCPSVDCAILLRPTMSAAMYLQQVGRALRPSEGKSEAIILDHVGNSHTHGMPDDDRVWELTATAVRDRKKPEVPSPRICPSCFGANRAGTQVCKLCGTPFPSEAREVEQVDGELAEMEAARVRREARRDQAKADSLEGLRELAKQRGHKPAWADHVWAARQKKRAG